MMYRWPDEVQSLREWLDSNGMSSFEVPSHDAKEMVEKGGKMPINKDGTFWHSAGGWVLFSTTRVRPTGDGRFFALRIGYAVVLRDDGRGVELVGTA